MLRTFETKHGWFQAHTQEEADQIALTGQMVVQGRKDAPSEPRIDTAGIYARRRAQSAQVPEQLQGNPAHPGSSVGTLEHANAVYARRAEESRRHAMEGTPQ